MRPAQAVATLLVMQSRACIIAISRSCTQPCKQAAAGLYMQSGFMQSGTLPPHSDCMQPLSSPPPTTPPPTTLPPPPQTPFLPLCPLGTKHESVVQHRMPRLQRRPPKKPRQLQRRPRGRLNQMLALLTRRRRPRRKLTPRRCALLLCTHHQWCTSGEAHVAP